MVKQFWDKWKAWPTCLKGLDGRPSCSGTYQRLGRRVWKNWLDDELFWDLWRAWSMSLKGLDESPTCYVTYGGFGRRVWRGWMRGRHVIGGRAILRLLEGLANVFEGDWRPTCYGTYQRLGQHVWRDCMRGQAILGLMEGLAGEFEGTGWEPDVFWDLWRAWPTCLKGLDWRRTCYKTYAGLGWHIWRGWMGGWHVMKVMEGLADVFERVGWEADVFWHLWYY